MSVIYVIFVTMEMQMLYWLVLAIISRVHDLYSVALLQYGNDPWFLLVIFVAVSAAKLSPNPLFSAAFTRTGVKWQTQCYIRKCLMHLNKGNSCNVAIGFLNGCFHFLLFSWSSLS